MVCAVAGIDLDEARRKREDNIVQLRKDRRDESLQKKRMVGAVFPAGEKDSMQIGTGAMAQKVTLLMLMLVVQARPRSTIGTRRLDSHAYQITIAVSAVNCCLFPWLSSAVGEPAGYGTARVVQRPASTAGVHHSVPQAPLYW
jgi:hypothetical protein